MHEFYLKALLRGLLLLCLSALAGYVCVTRSYHQEPLLDAERDYAWQLLARDEVGSGGVGPRPKAEAGHVVMEYSLSPAANYPYAGTVVAFTDKRGAGRMLDWSGFGKMSFVARCFPASTLVFTIATFDKEISTPGNIVSYRLPAVYFDCSEAGTPVEVDLAHMTIPQWWFDMFKVSPSDQRYALDQVAQIEFGTSNRSRAGLASRVEISDIALHDRRYGYLYFLGVFLLALWCGYGFWFFRDYARTLSNELRSRMRKDMPLVAYQQLSLEPHRDKEKSVILTLLATRYADPELDLDQVVGETGINRNKINEILKAEMGYTFISYLNKLRLTEASRLLAENATAKIAEIAYSVGYKNPSYFNKLFKDEYGCTPKAFREVCNRDMRLS